MNCKLTTIEKILQSKDARVYWCPTMDLLGIVSAEDNKVQIARCDTKIQLLLQIENVSSPSAFAFASHGKHFAVGYIDGRVSIVSTETGNELFHFDLSNGEQPS